MRSLRSRAGSVHPWWRRFKRNGYRRDRCEGCGHRFRWSRDPRHSFGNRDGKVWHGPCIALVQWRGAADERLAILDLICEVWAVTDRDVKGVVEMRTADDASGARLRNQAFRVFYDLSNRERV